VVDRSKIGHEWAPYTMQVERGKVREFADAVFSDDAVYRDVEAARAAGYPDLPVPPTFSAVTAHWSPQTSVEDDLGVDLKRVLAGGAEWEYLGEIVAGETLTVRGRIADIVEKQGSRGPMTLVIRENTFCNERGEDVLRVRSTMIELGQPADGGSA
jgi:hypothetical protein